MTTKVAQFEGRNGKVKNQFILTTKDGVYFQSYESIIAFKPKPYKRGKIQLDRKYWNYSKTTGKYRNIFLGESLRETEEKIKSGEYLLTDLNNDTCES